MERVDSSDWRFWEEIIDIERPIVALIEVSQSTLVFPLGYDQGNVQQGHFPFKNHLGSSTMESIESWVAFILILVWILVMMIPARSLTHSLTYLEPRQACATLMDRWKRWFSCLFTRIHNHGTTIESSLLQKLQRAWMTTRTSNSNQWAWSKSRESKRPREHSQTNWTDHYQSLKEQVNIDETLGLSCVRIRFIWAKCLNGRC